MTDVTTQPSDWAVALPCPFCGETPHVGPEHPEIRGNAWGFVECQNDGCAAQPRVEDGEDIADERGSDAYKQCAIKRWNRRAPVARELDASGGGDEESLLSIVREGIRNAERNPRKTYGLQLETLRRIEQVLATPRAAEAGDAAKWRAFREMPEHDAADIAWLNPGEERDAAMGAVGD